MFTIMKKLIERKFYPGGETAQGKLDVFYAVNRLSDGEYKTLTELRRKIYGN